MRTPATTNSDVSIVRGSSGTHGKGKERAFGRLSNLPYDLLLNISAYLSIQDVRALQLTCKPLSDFSTTRPVYRYLAYCLLQRCRALPLQGFQSLRELTTDQLIWCVNQATRLENAWRVRGPRPLSKNTNCLDYDPGPTKIGPRNWYKVLSSPDGEEIDWLSPITSSYTLCSTRTGKVLCWDVKHDRCLGEWDPGEGWELWKCRVEFEEHEVYFTMAKVLSGAFDDGRVLEFMLVKLNFLDATATATTVLPEFSRLMGFKTTGVVMNVFLLDPQIRLLSAFVWVASVNTIGLYTLLDWNRGEYVFIDTGIECIMSSNWSCILHEDQLVIHCEETEAAYQHFYPMSALETYVRKFPADGSAPVVTARVPPYETISRRYRFPVVPTTDVEDLSSTVSNPGTVVPATATAGPPDFTPPHSPMLSSTEGSVAGPRMSPDRANPFPFPPWYPESAHFVRQWWPTMRGIPKVSCTVVLLASHDTETHKTRFVLAQHYFRVPLHPDHKLRSFSPRDVPEQDKPSTEVDKRDEDDGGQMENNYVSTPFEVVCVLDSSMLDEDPDERPRPLVAVDFGHAVWIEYFRERDDQKRLRFVTFPSYGADGEGMGEVRTLEVPAEVDLDHVETINLDQSQGAVILSVREGKIFMLYYE